MPAVSQAMQPPWSDRPPPAQDPHHPAPGWAAATAPPDAPPGGGIINLTVQGSVMSSSFVPPSLTINGHRVGLPSSGTQRIPAPAGVHHLVVSCQWIRTYGQAELSVHVAPGQQVDVFYAAPMHQFTTGSIGFEPQTRKGKGFVFGLLGVMALIFLISIIRLLLG